MMKRHEFVPLCVALVAAAGLVLGFWGCGDEDLAFPGQVRPTPTPEDTATPAPTATP